MIDYNDDYDVDDDADDHHACACDDVRDDGDDDAGDCVDHIYRDDVDVYDYVYAYGDDVPKFPRKLYRIKIKRFYVY